MAYGLRRGFLGGMLAVFVVTQIGCAAGRPTPRLDDSARASVGTVAVRWEEAPPRVQVYATHSAGQGAAKGAGTGAKAGMPLMAVGQVPTIAGAMIGLAGVGMSLAGALVGAPIGAIVGAVKAPPKAVVRAVEWDFTTQAVVLDPAGCVGDRIHHTLRREGSAWSVLVPVAPGSAGDRAAARRLAAQPVDSVLHLGPVTIEASGPFGTHPDGALILRVPVRLVRATDGVELLAHEFRSAQAEAAFTGWPADAPRFAEALELACRVIAQDIVSAVTGDAAPADPPGEEPAGRAGGAE